MSLFTERKINIASSDVAPVQHLEVFGDATIAGNLAVYTNVAVSGTIQSGEILSSGAIKSSAGASAATSGIGYSTGAGATVTQTGGRGNAVVINALCGAITLVSAAGPNGTPQTFTVTNSAVAATDVIVVSQKSGTDRYKTQAVTAVTNGSFTLTLDSIGATTEQPVFNFAVIKAVTA